MIFIARASNVTVVKREGETTDKVIRRFKKACERADLMKDLRRNDYYIAPSLKKQLKSKEAEKRRRREAIRAEKNYLKWQKRKKDLSNNNSISGPATEIVYTSK